MKDNKIKEILGDRITGKESLDILREITGLAKKCLSGGGRKPTMREVAEKLHILKRAPTTFFDATCY